MPFPKEGEVFDYQFVKEDLGQWVPWTDALKEAPPIAKDAQFNSIIIPTVDTVRYSHLMDMLVRHEKPCLFVGPTGTGKSVYIQVNCALFTIWVNWGRGEDSPCPCPTQLVSWPVRWANAVGLGWDQGNFTLNLLSSIGKCIITVCR